MPARTRVLLAVVLGTHGVQISSLETPPNPARAESVTIEYVAHACFRFTSPDGARVLVDPFASRVWIGYDFPPGIDADTVLITHPHYDHDGGVSVDRRPPWAEGATVLREPGLHDEGGFRILGIRGKHADPWGKEFGQTNTVWLLEAAGLRIAHLGDNGPLSRDAIDKLGKVDILLVPIDSKFHILQRDEIRAILEEMSPRIVIPMHYRHPDLESDDSAPEDLGDIDGWLRQRERVRRLASHEIRISPDDLPAEQEILVLQHWPAIQRQ